jgi:hypothetical protein
MFPLCWPARKTIQVKWYLRSVADQWKKCIKLEAEGHAIIAEKYSGMYAHAAAFKGWFS